MTHSSLLRVTLAALVTFGGAVACAAAPGDAPAVAVRYHDLDLSTANGAQMLYHRIQSAALKVCGAPHAINPVHRREQRLCYANAVASAVDTVNQPRLSDLHHLRTGRSPV